MLEFNDKPIDSPDDDKFGFNSFAKAIADSISKMKSPEGTVIAINGPWGSGKSSLINLIRNQLNEPADLENTAGIFSHLINLVRHRLRNAADKDDLKIVNFKCWWFRGAEALTIEFFRALYSEMKPNMSRKAKKGILKLVPQLLAYTSSVIDSATGIPGSTLMAAKSVSNFIKQSETVENLHREISDALSKDTRRRYLIIIDDLDRLSPDEAMLIFRLVKSFGGLPNVIYLLAYDRKLAQEIVAQRYPPEGQKYLEKIIQASFDLPEPSPAALEKEFLTRLDSVIEEREYRDNDYFHNLFDEIIAPAIKTPRDLIRISNPLKVTWPAVKEEVNVTDFLCIETLRIQRPELYRALRSNKDRLTKTESGEEAMERGYRSRPPSEDSETQPYKHPQAQTYEDIFLNREPETERERLRRGLMLLFPALARTWSPSNYRDDDPDTWERQRRVCSPKHFDTYFRFALQDSVLSSREIKELIAGTGDPAFIRKSFLDASQRKLTNGDTRAGLLLDALRVDANEIADNDVRSLLKAVYSIADVLIVEDEEIFKFDNMMRRLDYLTEALTMQRLNLEERFSLEERSDILLDVCQGATLTYLMRIATWAYGQHFPQNEATRNFRNLKLTTRDHACKLKNMTIIRIREAAVDCSLNDVPYLGDVLLWWIKAEDDDRRIRSWASNVFENNFAVARLAKAFISLAPYRDPQESLEAYWEKELGHVVELGEFRSRADQALRDENLGKEDRDVLQRFLNAF